MILSTIKQLKLFYPPIVVLSWQIEIEIINAKINWGKMFKASVEIKVKLACVSRFWNCYFISYYVINFITLKDKDVTKS